MASYYSDLFRAEPKYDDRDNLRWHKDRMIKEYEDPDEGKKTWNLMQRVHRAGVSIAPPITLSLERDRAYIETIKLPIPSVLGCTREEQEIAFGLWRDEIRKVIQLGISPQDADYGGNVLFDKKGPRVYLIDLDEWIQLPDPHFLRSIADFKYDEEEVLR